MAVFETPNGGLINDTTRADNIRDRLAMNASRPTVMPPAPQPVEAAFDPNDPFIPGTNLRLSEFQAMQQQRQMQQAMAQQQQLLGNAGALAPASIPSMPSPAIRSAAPASPSASLPTGFVSIDLLNWEVVADNGQRFPLLTQEEGRSVVAFCYNIMIRAINNQTAELRKMLGIPEPTIQTQMMPQQQEAPSGPATGNEGVQVVPRPKARKRVPKAPADL